MSNGGTSSIGAGGASRPVKPDGMIDKQRLLAKIRRSLDEFSGLLGSGPTDMSPIPVSPQINSKDLSQISDGLDKLVAQTKQAIRGS